MSCGDSQAIDKPSETTLQNLSDRAGQYRASSKSEATKKAYQSDLKLFVTWCQDHDRSPLPALPDTVALYITYLAELGRATSTIARALTSISQSHKIADLRTPTNAPEVTTVWQGIQRTHGVSQRQAKPLLLADLKKVVDTLRPTFIGRRDRALLLVGWAGALRRSELVALDFADIEFVDEGFVLTIRKSKTDQTGKEYKLGIPFARAEKICPVRALRKWIDLARIDKGPLFYQIGTPGKRFHAELAKKTRLKPRSVNLIITRRVKQAGLSPHGYSGHSLRAGFITSAAKKETPENLIQIHTRHRSIKILRGYIRDGSLFANNPLSILL